MRIATPADAPAKPQPPAFPEPLRQHLQDRVQRYRARQENRSLPLPFDDPEPPAKVISFPAPPMSRMPAPHVPAQPAREEHPPAARTPERQATLPASPPASSQASLAFKPLLFEEEPWRARAVAPLEMRFRGQLRDLGWMLAGLLVLAFPLPLAPYAAGRFLPGPLLPSVLLLGGLLCGSLVLALVYALLFYSVSGTTPGMRAAGLRLVTFDGKTPSRMQRLYRVLGALVSAGSFGIGFLWALVDEEKLYWHDHISKTLLTPADIKN